MRIALIIMRYTKVLFTYLLYSCAIAHRRYVLVLFVAICSWLEFLRSQFNDTGRTCQSTSQRRSGP